MKRGRSAKIATPLAHCAAFVPSRVSPELWMPCTEPALRRGLFCAKHREAIDGAVLGASSLGILCERNDKHQGSRSSRAKKPPAAKKVKDPMRFASRSPRL